MNFFFDAAASNGNQLASLKLPDGIGPVVRGIRATDVRSVRKDHVRAPGLIYVN